MWNVLALQAMKITEEKCGGCISIVSFLLISAE